MSVGAVLGEAWSLYTRFFWRLVGTAAAVYVVVDLVAALLYSIGRHNVALWVVCSALTFVVILIGTFLVQGALVLAVQDARDGKIDSTIGGLYSRVGPRLPALIAAGIVAGLGIGLGFILFIIPGLFLLTRWCLIVPTIMLEEKGAGDSFGRSNQLVKGASWSVLGVVVVSGLLAGIGGRLVEAIFATIFNRFLGVWIGGVISHSVTVPFVAAAWTLMYYKRAEA